MACPSCLVAFAGSESLGDTVATQMPNPLAITAGCAMAAIGAAALTGIIVYAAMKPAPMFTANRRRRRRR